MNLPSLFVDDWNLPSLPGLSHHLSIPRHLDISIDQLAARQLLINVTTPEANSTRGFLEFVVPLMDTANADSYLSHAFAAAALAEYKRRQNSAVIVPRARISYLKALKTVEAALKDPVEMSTDAMLASVLLLARCEVRLSIFKVAMF